MGGKIYLNITYGLSNKLPGFININSEPSADVQWDVTQGLPFKDSSIDGIYSERFVEHLSQQQIFAFLRECRRVLRPGGVLRLVTSDLAEIIRQYENDNWRQSLLDDEGFSWIRTKAEYVNVLLKERWIVDEEEWIRVASWVGLEDSMRCVPGKSRDEYLVEVNFHGTSSLIMEFQRRIDVVSDNPLVSIIIPAFRSDFFSVCLDSAIRQTYRNIEILVLDDSPGFEIEEITRQFMVHDVRILYWRNDPPLKESCNLQRGIKLARGEFIKPLYDDDLLENDAVERLLKIYREIPDARLAAGRRIPIDEAGDPLDERLLGEPLSSVDGRLRGERVIGHVLYTGTNSIGEPTCMMFRRSDALAIDESLIMNLFDRPCWGMGDICLALHLLSKGDLAYIAEPIARFRIHGGQSQRQEGFLELALPTWDYVRQQAVRLGFPLAPLSTWRSQETEIPQQERDLANPYTTYLTRHHSPFHPDDPLPADSPVVTFVVPCSSAELPLLADTLDSLGVQSAPLWRLVVLADAPAPDAMWDELPMLRWRALASLEEMGEALGEELEAVASGWVSVFAPGVRLAADAVEQLVRHALAFPQWRLMYGDSDTVDADGARRDPLFRPDVNLDLLRSMPYLGPCLWVEREAFAAVGGLGEHGGAWRYDLALRVLDAFGEEAIGHVDGVLYSLPTGREEGVDEPAHRQALAAHLARRGLEAEVAEGYVPGTWRVVYHWPRQPRVSIIIPTKDQADYLQSCVESIRAKTAYPDYEILVVDNGSTQPEALAYLERLKADGVRVLPYPKPFNFSAMCNLAAREASGEYLLLLNNDTAVLQEHWLERMVAYGQRPDVGIVGVKLMFPQPPTVQHVGVILGLGGIAEHPYLGLLGLTEGGYMNRALVDQDLSAVTAACLLIRKSVWEEVKGLDEQAFRVSYNDVDLCLKVRERGYKILWTPFVVLVHHGSVSQQQEAAEPAKARKAQQRFGKEQEAMLRKWLPQLARDPAYNRHLSLTHRDYRVEPEIVVNWDPRLPSEKVRVLGWEQLSGVIEYRIKQPLEGLWQARAAERSFIHAPGVRQTRIPLLVEVERAKPDVFTASAFLELSDHLETVRQVQEVARIPFLLHLDDLISEIPRQSEVYEHRNTPGEMKRVVRTADRVVVTTEPIRSAIEKYAREVRLIPNYLPGWVWNGLKSERRVGPKPRVGWAGAMQHAGDLALIREVVEATSEECDWVFFGMCPEELRPFVKEFHPFVPFEQYPAKLASLDLDLAVAPLEVNRFNECKSNLRLLEYGILGWPVVCSDVLPYRGAPVTRVPNRPEAWLEAIRARIHDLDEAQKEGEALQRWVREGWMLEDHLGEWIEAYRFGG